MKFSYKINNQEVTQEEFEEHSKSSSKLKDMLSAPRRAAPGGHEKYWGTGHESLAMGVPPVQAKEHHDLCVEAGLVGVEIRKDGCPEFSSPGNRAQYMKHFGYADQGQAGGGSVHNSYHKKHYRRLSDVPRRGA